MNWMAKKKNNNEQRKQLEFFQSRPIDSRKKEKTSTDSKPEVSLDILNFKSIKELKKQEKAKKKHVIKHKEISQSQTDNVSSAVRSRDPSIEFSQLTSDPISEQEESIKNNPKEEKEWESDLIYDLKQRVERIEKVLKLSQ